MRNIIFALFVLCCFSGICFAQEGNGISTGKIERTDKNAALKILSMPKPSYTEEGRKNKTSGIVKLRIKFSENGKIGGIQVVQSLPDGLAEKAIVAARNITFLPERKDGKNITVIKVLPFNFNID